MDSQHRTRTRTRTALMLPHPHSAHVQPAHGIRLSSMSAQTIASFTSDDLTEAMTAFMEKRPATFTGN